ncbi:hypothetical protein [Duganella sp. BuS-21]|uniref:hypothetical protein n=1 Tax=Duganella sp. BuS-21 TaxID=2943848 RepID=UPI0035A6AB38
MEGIGDSILQIYSITGFPAWRTSLKALIFLGNARVALHFLTRATALSGIRRDSRCQRLTKLNKKDQSSANAVKLSDVVPAKAGIHAELAGHAPHGFPHARE